MTKLSLRLWVSIMLAVLHVRGATHNDMEKRIKPNPEYPGKCYDDVTNASYDIDETWSQKGVCVQYKCSQAKNGDFLITAYGSVTYEHCSHLFVAHTDSTVNRRGNMATENLPVSIYVTTPGTNTSTPNCGNGTLSNETEGTLNGRGLSEVTSEVRGVASCEGIPSMQTDKGYKAKSIQELYRGSEIQEFYRGANVLVTGGTGFMGKVLVEKLLRSCPHLSNIYLLVRSKKGKDVASRVEALFDGPLFEKLKSEDNGFRKKVIAVEGDCREPDLGLSPDDRQRIVEHVNIVFHMAATVRFNETLPAAVATNVLGTRDLMLLCQDCTRIKAVVYVSTAYSHCNRSVISEELYDPPITYDGVIKLTECLDENTLTAITPTLLGAWPNTYVYTKAIAEDTVKTLARDLPVGVFRPSIIVSTRSDPLPGWIDNHYGPTGFFVSMGLGIIRTVHVNEKTVGDMVPCDMAVSALVAAAWHIQERRRSGIEGIPVYNYVSSCENPITWDNYIQTTIEHSWQAPFDKSVWMVTLTYANVYFLYKIYALFFHFIPAFVVDIVLFSLGQKPRAMKTYEKLHKFINAISYFCTRQWKFSNQNVQQLWSMISEDDRKIFDFDVCNLNWDQYLGESVMGMRKFLLKDDPKKLSDAIKKRYRLYWLHQGVKFTLIFLFLWLCWLTTRTVFQLGGETATATVGKDSSLEHSPVL